MPAALTCHFRFPDSFNNLPAMRLSSPLALLHSLLEQIDTFLDILVCSNSELWDVAVQQSGDVGAGGGVAADCAAGGVGADCGAGRQERLIVPHSPRAVVIRLAVAVAVVEEARAATCVHGSVAFRLQWQLRNTPVST